MKKLVTYIFVFSFFFAINSIAKNPNNNTTAPTCVQKKNINAILRLAPSQYHAIRKKDGINMTSKNM